MKRFSWLIFLVALYSTSSCTENDDNTYLLSFNAHKTITCDNVFSNVEVIMLHDNEGPFKMPLENFIVTDNLCIGEDSQDYLYVFDTNGRLLSDSKKVKGKSKTEYTSCFGYNFDKTRNVIQIIDLYKVQEYDLAFNYVRTISLPNKEIAGTFFEDVYILNDSIYVLRPTSLSTPTDCMYVYNINSREVIKTIDYSDDKWYYISRRKACLTDIDRKTMFYPDGTSNYTYVFDKESMTLGRHHAIVFPDGFVKLEELPDRENELEYVKFSFTSDCVFLDNLFFLDDYYVGVFRIGGQRDDYYVITNSDNESIQAKVFVDEIMILPIATVSHGNCLYAIDSSSNLSYCSYDFNQVVNNVSADDECYYLLKYTINSDVIK